MWTADAVNSKTMTCPAIMLARVAPLRPGGERLAA
jgi:hypothetical protein